MVERRKYIQKASLTIEAAYITFLTILIVVSVLMISFHLYDRAVIRAQATYLGELTLRTSFKWIDAGSKHLQVDEELSHQLKDDWQMAYGAHVSAISGVGKSMMQAGMSYTRIDHVDIQCQYSALLKRLTCTVTVDGTLNFPLNIFGVSNLKVNEVCNVSEFDAIRYLWLKTLIAGENE